jgi:hypothetical protein
MSLIENAAQSSNRNLVFSGDDRSIDDRSSASHKLYMAALLGSFFESSGLKSALDFSERLRAKPTQLQPRSVEPWAVV